MKSRLDLGKHLLPILLFVAGFSYYLYLQLRYPMLYGIDGAFYAGETKCILLSGLPCLVDSPLPLYIPVLFTMAGVSVEYSVKISLALFTSITVIPLYLLSYRIGGRVNAVIVSIVYLFNPFTMRLGVEFLKNLVGLFFLALFFYYFYIVFVEEKYHKRKILYPIILLTALSHILVYGILVLYTIIAAAYAFLYRKTVFKKILFILVSELIIAIMGVATPILGWSPYFQSISEESGQLVVFKTIDYASPEALLSFIAIALTAYTIYANGSRRLIALPLLLVETIALVPLPVFAGLSWRTLLLFSIYLPLSMTLCIRRRTPSKSYYIIGTSILLLSVTVSASNVIGCYKPMIQSEVISELKEVIPGYVGSGNVILIVPDKILRHWVFFIASPCRVFEDYESAVTYLNEKSLNPSDYEFLEIVYSPNPDITPPEPEAPHILLYHGKYVYVYEIKA